MKMEGLERKLKSAQHARLEAEVEIARLRAELEGRTQLLNMRWERTEVNCGTTISPPCTVRGSQAS